MRIPVAILYVRRQVLFLLFCSRNVIIVHAKFAIRYTIRTTRYNWQGGGHPQEHEHPTATQPPLESLI